MGRQCHNRLYRPIVNSTGVRTPAGLALQIGRHDFQVPFFPASFD